VGANGEPQDPRAASWLEAGASFEWRPARGTDGSVRIFHAEFGSHDAPVLLLLHGFPTSSLDWSDVVGRLGATHRVCTLDFPGYGFSDKPEDWPYSLFLDAELVAHYLTTVVGERRCTVPHTTAVTASPCCCTTWRGRVSSASSSTSSY
jgi:hypothetical protein